MIFRFLYITFLFLSLTAFADDNKPVFDEKKWEEITRDVNYTEKQEDKTEFSAPLFNWDLNTEILQYIFFFLIIGILIFFLVKYILTLQGNALSNEEMKMIEVETLKDAEENPMHSDLEKLIDKLLDQHDYRGAIRAYFLLVLQNLNNRKMIEWKKPKTNFDYVNEVSKHPFHSTFYAVTNYFEWVWYGNHLIEKSSFKEVETEFKNLVDQIKK